MKRYIIILASLVIIPSAVFLLHSRVILLQGLRSNIFTSNANQAVDSDSAGASSVKTATPIISDVLQKFQDQIQSLNTEVASLHSEIEIINLRNIFKRNLRLGDKGEDVSKLQELLIEFPDLYSADVDFLDAATGLYGAKTKTIVENFQSQTGIKQTGIFDSITREKFYKLIKELSKADNSASTDLSSIDVSSIANLNNEDNPSKDTSTKSQLSSELSDVKSEISDLQNQLLALQSSATAPLSSSVSDSTPASAPAPAATPPASSSTSATTASTVSASSTTSKSAPTPAPAPAIVLSNIQNQNITQKSAAITWTTNLSSNSEVDYSTDATLPSTKITITSSNNMVTSHTLGLQNLNSSTKYYYRVVSKNTNGATATSAILNFSTLH